MWRGRPLIHVTGRCLSSSAPNASHETLERYQSGVFSLNRIEHLILAVTFSVQQEAHLLSKLFGFLRNRAAMGHVFERSNGGNDTVELLFGLLEAGLLLNVPGDFILVIQSLR